MMYQIQSLSMMYVFSLLSFFQFKGVGSFFFRLEDIANFTKKLVGTELFIRAIVWDFYYEMDRVGQGKALIMDDVVRLRFLGGPIRVFKPGVPFDVYVSRMIYSMYLMV